MLGTCIWSKKLLCCIHHGEELRGEISLEVAYAILRSFYVDDFLGSYPDVETARKVCLDLTVALGKGGLILTKWKFSHPAVLDERVGLDERIKVLLEKDSSMSTPAEKVLGVAYSFEDDDFTIINDNKAKKVVKTQRHMVSIVHALFDPLGIMAPFTLIGKEIMQRAMALKLD
jgi:hypothetical protein